MAISFIGCDTDTSTIGCDTDTSTEDNSKLTTININGDTLKTDSETYLTIDNNGVQGALGYNNGFIGYFDSTSNPKVLYAYITGYTFTIYENETKNKVTNIVNFKSNGSYCMNVHDCKATYTYGLNKDGTKLKDERNDTINIIGISQKFQNCFIFTRNKATYKRLFCYNE